MFDPLSRKKDENQKAFTYHQCDQKKNRQMSIKVA